MLLTLCPFLSSIFKIETIVKDDDDRKAMAEFVYETWEDDQKKWNQGQLDSDRRKLWADFWVGHEFGDTQLIDMG